MLEIMGKKARLAARKMALAPTDQKNQAILYLAKMIWTEREEILEANLQDVTSAVQSGLQPAMIDRLTLNDSRLEGMVSDLQCVAELPDPVGETFDVTEMPNGLRVHKQRVPIGVLGVIYEARPNVTLDVSSLAVKSGNCVILRGGSETLRTNTAMVQVIQSALKHSGLPEEAVQFIAEADRARVLEMLKLHNDIDMIIPRGSATLHQFCRENSQIPVITGGIGICHLFVDESADQQAAIQVIRNAKVQRPTVCNALDTILVHRSVAEKFLPDLVTVLQKDGVEIRADAEAFKLLQGTFSQSVKPAGRDDFDTEWLSLVLGVKVVANVDEALQHIAEHSSGHSDGILTNDPLHSARFVAEVDSAAVYVNASTRFTDGSQLGLGAEVAISTQRLHARGPMGLRELTTYKWVVAGDYHVRE